MQIFIKSSVTNYWKSLVKILYTTFYKVIRVIQVRRHDCTIDKKILSTYCKVNDNTCQTEYSKNIENTIDIDNDK